MTWPLGAALALAFVAVFVLDWIRRDLKFGGRKRAWMRRVAARHEHLPRHGQEDYVAALLHARAAGRLVVTPALIDRLWPPNEGWSEKVRPIR